MLRKFTIIVALALSSAAASAALAGQSAPSLRSTQEINAGDNTSNPQPGGSRDIVVYDDGPGLGGGY